jgi:hypothetical protein
MGYHVLLLLERPEHLSYHDDLPKLFALVSNALLKQSAVVWTTSNQQIWESTALTNNIKRYKIRSGQLLQVEEK